MFHPRSLTPKPRAAYTDYTPAGPWADQTIVTRNFDGVGFLYDATLNSLSIVPNKSYVTKDSNHFPIINVPDPVNPLDASNKEYVDAHGGSGGGGIADAPSDGTLYGRENAAWVNAVPLAGGTMTGLLTLSAVPTASLGAATKGYVDGAVAQPSNATPTMAGTAAPGTSLLYSRGDHAHPTDTSRAPLASPNFTGAPTSPTPLTADNSTEIATTAFVKAQGYQVANATITLSGDVSGSGATAITTTLATVNSNVGTYQGITVNGKGLVTGAVNMNYAPLASPAFTGSPTSTTQASTDNSTNIATTAYVKGQGYLTGNQTVTLSGDVSGSGTTAITATLATVNSNVGTYQGLTVNGKGLVTNAVNMNYAPLASPQFTGVSNFTGPAPNITVQDTTALAVGIGGEVDLQAVNGAGTQVTYAGIKAYATNGNAGAEIGDLEILVRAAGAVKPWGRFVSNGNILFNAGGTLTPNASGTLTLPAATDTLVGRATTDTLSNKTLASPSLIGTPTAPTATAGTSTTQIASTAFVMGAGFLSGNQTVTLSGDVTGSGATAITATIAASAVTNAKLANSGAYTLKGNNTAASAAPQDFTIAGLTSKAAPVAADAILISDSAASGAFKQVPWSSVAGGGAAGVTLEVNLAANQTGLAVSGWRQAKYDTKVTDTQNAYSTSTGLFTPTQAGLYAVSATLAMQSGTGSGIGTAIVKNGNIANAESQSTELGAGVAGTTQICSASALIYCNGTTDNISVWGWQAGSGTGIFYSAANAAVAINMIATLLQVGPQGPAGPAGPTEIPSGTVMLFWQGAAPTGWTQVTTQNDKAIRVVSGTGGVSGGTNAFSTVMAQTTTGAHTLALGELPTGITSPWSATITTYMAGTAGNATPFSSGGGWAMMIVSYGSGYYAPNAATNVGFSYSGNTSAANSATATSNNTSAGSHTHPLTMSIQYIDVILASKN